MSIRPESEPIYNPLVAHLAVPHVHGRPAPRGLDRLAWLLPRRWRRRVMIGGTQFWVPG